jgi:hypothetical protein
MSRALEAEDTPAYRHIANAGAGLSRMPSRQIARGFGNGVGTAAAFVGPAKLAPGARFGARSNLGIDMSLRSRAAETAAPRVLGPTGDVYSVAYEMKLSPTSYPGVSRGAHFQEANGSLLQAMEGDVAFAQDMQNLGINLQRTPTGLAPRTSPSGWTWHHAEDPGVMQLVPRSQHQPGSIFQDALHPNGVGGYSIWGK